MTSFSSISRIIIAGLFWACHWAAHAKGCQNGVTQDLNKEYSNTPQLFVSLDCQNPKIVYVNNVQVSDDGGRLLSGVNYTVSNIQSIARSDGLRDPIAYLIQSGRATGFTVDGFTRDAAQTRRESAQAQQKLIASVCAEFRRVSAIRHQCSAAGNYLNCMDIRAGGSWEKTLESGAVLCAR